MPYMMVADGDNYSVYKQGPDKKQTGAALNKKPMTRAQATKYMAALNAATADENKALSDVDLVELEEKCYSDYSPMVNKLSQDDPRAGYDPMGGRTGDKACANCRWFHPGSASCDLIWGEIVPTGVSNLWLSKQTPADPNQPKPIPVVIVEPDVDADDSGAMDVGSMALGGKAPNPDDYAYVPDKKAPSTWKLPIGDEKHARLALAAIGSNPPHGNKVDIPADAMPGVRKKIEAAIRKYVKDKDEVKRLLGGKSLPQTKSLIHTFFDLLGGSKADDATPAPVGEGFKVADDGRWTAWWTNNAKDRVGEWFSSKSIDDYIARVDAGVVPYPELWFKHIPMRMGKADALARIGYLAFATGTFYDTPVGRSGKAYFLAKQKAGEPTTNSHGYLFPTNLKSKGVHHAFNSFEISTLDPGEEANPYTLFEVKSMFKDLMQDQKKLDELVDIFGKEEVERLKNFGEAQSKALEQAGVDLKSFEGFDGVDVKDEAAQEGVRQLAGATLAGLKKIAGRLDGIETKLTEIETKANGSAQAVADLKSFVEGEFGMAPRASKAAATQIAATDAQVAHLQQKNAEAGQDKTEALPESVSEFGKGIFAEIAKAMKAS